ncbi:MAG: GAF domain-containing protein, partial [Candidatus Binatia bacterium]
MPPGSPLAGVGTRPTAEADLNDALFAIVRVATAVCAAEIAFITLVDEAREELRIVAAYGESPPLVGTHLPVFSSLSGQVLASQRSVRSADLANDRRSFTRKVGHLHGTRAILIVPVWDRGRVIGTLAVGSRTPSRFSARCESLLNDLAKNVRFVLPARELRS